MASCELIYRKTNTSVIPEWFDPKNDGLKKGDEFICLTGGSSIGVKGAPDRFSAERLSTAIKTLPVSMKSNFTHMRTFKVLEPKEFNLRFGDVKGPFSSKTGLAYSSGDWFVRGDLLTAGYKKSLDARLWFAVISLISEVLSEENGFDRAIFERAFLRRLKKDPNIKEDEIVYDRFIGAMFREERFDREKIAELFRYLRRPETKERTSVQPNDLPGSTEAMLVRDVYRQFADRGIRIKRGRDQIAVGLKSVSSTERPKGTHRVNLHYLSGAINGWLGSTASLIMPENVRVKMEWAPGLVGLYEKRRATGGKEMKLVAGSFLDVKLAEMWFGRSYIGAPISLYGGKRDERLEWELGVQYRSPDRDLFFSATYNSPVTDSSSKYMGLGVRWEG